MKITKKYVISFMAVSLFVFIQVAGVLIVQNNALAANSLWETQQGMGLSGPGQGTIGSVGFSKAGDVKDVRTIIGSIIRVFLGFLGIIFTVLLILAGFKWMTSQGNDQAIAEAKGQIQAAMIGIMVITASYGIAQAVMVLMAKTSN